jgi:tRNA nucleotidyltransferase (CCA-adding enzyme)
MKIYLVGGAVRDELMGETPEDLDYVVVGSSPEEMLSLGYKQVGSSFPVFLHPETGDEYALARTEKSTGEKYGDFDCYFGKDVTLKDDLYRRDLTINAIAKDLDTGEYVDPFNGIEDINNKVLRKVSDAFEEDPVRILRAFRFQSTLEGDWSFNLNTLVHVYSMILKGALDSATPERVWKEVEKVVSGRSPGKFFRALRECDLFPEICALWETPQNEEHHPEGNVGIHTMMVVDYAAQHYAPVVVFAGLCHDFGKPVSYKESGNALQHEIKGLPVIKAFCEKWKVPNNYRDLALMTCEHHTKVHGCLGRGSNKAMRAKAIMKLFTDTNALAKPLRFFHMLSACEADAKGRGGDYPNKPYKQKDYLLDCLAAAKGVNTKEITLSLLAKGKSGVEIGEAVRIARIDAIRNVNNKTGTQND